MSNKAVSVYAEAMKQQNQKPAEDQEASSFSPIQPETKKESKPTNKQSSKQTSNKENKLTSKHVYMKTLLDEKSSGFASFRLPPGLLDKLDEIQFLLKFKYKAKPTRYAIVTAALAFLFWDFEKNGDKSQFFHLLVESEK